MNIFKTRGKETGGERREVRYAGTWYEDDVARLTRQMDSYLKEAKLRFNESFSDARFVDNPSPAGGLLALIVPHAGYIFSGLTAAYAYQYARQNKTPKRIFLLGPSHYLGFHGIALSHCETFATVPGSLRLDSECINALVYHPLFSINEEIHRREHSLELQLPFIKHVYPDTKLVPLVVGVLNSETEIKEAGQVLRNYLCQDDLVVVSSDFTHYGPRYDYVPFKGDFPAKVKELDELAFGYIRDGNLSGFLDFHQRTGCTICGFYPCSLLLSMLPESTSASLLKYGTSQDTKSEDRNNSVSYLALALTDEKSDEGWKPETLNVSQAPISDLFTDEEKASLLKLARQVVSAFVQKKQILTDSQLDINITENMKKPFGVFVTLFKKGKKPLGKELRGCIGYIWPIKPLYQALIDNAVGACSKDYRFKPVKPIELDKLHIEISILTPLREINSADQIEIGKHGVVFHLNDNQSVFLPHVAVEFGWTKTETLAQLSLKAGLDKNAWKYKGARFEVFESVMFEELE